jgi:hypothetical protein
MVITPGPVESNSSFPLVALIAGMCVLSALVGALLSGGPGVINRMRIGRTGYRPLKTTKQWN